MPSDARASKYKVWLPENFEEERAARMKAFSERKKAEEERIRARIRQSANEAIRGYASPITGELHRGTTTLRQITDQVGQMRLQVDSDAVALAEIYGLTLQLQRAATIVGDMIGFEHSQPLDPAPARAQSYSIDPAAVSRSLKDTLEVVKRSAITLATAIRAQNQAVSLLASLQTSAFNTTVGPQDLVDIINETSPDDIKQLASLTSALSDLNVADEEFAPAFTSAVGGSKKGKEHSSS